MPINRLLDYFVQSGPETDGGRPVLVDAEGRFQGGYADLRLDSVFQPLFLADTLELTAHEALLRVRTPDGSAIPPGDAFAQADERGAIVEFDRLCRTLHALNFVRQSSGGRDLYLNVHAQHLLSITGHGEVFETLLGYCGLKPVQVVLEVLEARIEDGGRLQEAVQAYRQRGYRVAIDDFGCQHSNFDRLWQLTPDIVKLDRSLLVHAEINSRARRILPRLVEIVHELGALVVCEGIENPAQHELVRDAGADMVQGFFYGRPDAVLHGLQPGGNAVQSGISIEPGLRTALPAC